MKPLSGGGSFELLPELQDLGSSRDSMFWPSLSQPLGETLELRDKGIKGHAGLILVVEFPVIRNSIRDSRG